MLFKKVVQLVASLTVFCALSSMSLAVSNDDLDQLLVRGIEGGEFIHTQDNVSYFFLREHGQFIALHDIDDDAPLYRRDVKKHELAKGLIAESFSYPKEMLDHFKQHLLPLLMASIPDKVDSIITHYSARTLLTQDNTKATHPWDRNRTKGRGFITLINFNKASDGWGFRYDYPDKKLMQITNYWRTYNSLNDALEAKRKSSKLYVYSRDIAASIKLMHEENGVKAANVKEKQQAEKSRRTKEILASRQTGIVYKSEQFWEEFHDFSTMKKIFEGAFSDEVGQPQFKDDYLEFVKVNSMICGETIPANHFYVTHTSQIVHTVGGAESYREKPIVNTIRMEPRFKAKFLEYKKDPMRNLASKTMQKRHFQNRLKIIHPFTKTYEVYFVKGVDGAIKHHRATDRTQIMKRFFEKVSCKSATMFQIKENLWRAAYAKASLQAENIQIPNAASETISVDDLVSKQTFYAACLQDSKRKPNSEHYFCRCFDNTSRLVMTPQEREYYSADFKRIHDELYEKLPDQSSPLWRLRKPIDYCILQNENRYRK